MRYLAALTAAGVLALAACGSSGSGGSGGGSGINWYHEGQVYAQTMAQNGGVYGNDPVSWCLTDGPLALNTGPNQWSSTFTAPDGTKVPFHMPPQTNADTSEDEAWSNGCAAGAS